MANIKLLTSALLIVILLFTIESKFVSRLSSKLNLKSSNKVRKDDSTESNLNKTNNEENSDSTVNSSNTAKDSANNEDSDLKELECMKIFTSTISKLINEKRTLHNSQSLNYNLYLALTAQKLADEMAEIPTILDNKSTIFGETSYGMTTEKDFDFSNEKCESKHKSYKYYQLLYEQR